MKNKWINKILFVSMLSPMVAQFIVPTTSCHVHDKVVKNINGTDWDGIRAGSFEPEDYIVDVENETVTYTCGVALHATNLQIPNYVWYKNRKFKVLLGDYCFANNAGLTGIVELNDWMDYVPDYCFAQCYSLTGAVFHQYPKKIGDLAFYQCTILVKILVKKGAVLDPYWTIYLEKVGSYAFFNCWLQNELIFSNNLTEIGEYAFAGCFEVPLIDLSLCQSIETIPTGAFNRCTGCLTVELPQSITKIDRMAFKDCLMLQYVVVPREDMDIELGDYCFRGCVNLHTFTKKFTITKMGVGAFSYDKRLNIPIWDIAYGEKRIPAHAFTSCAMGSVAFDPVAVTDVGDYAFAECDELTVLDFSYFPAKQIPEWNGYHIFKGVHEGGTIYLASSSSVSSEWRTFFEQNDIDITKWNIKHKDPVVRRIDEPLNKKVAITAEPETTELVVEFKDFKMDLPQDDIDLSKLEVDFPFDKEKFPSLETSFAWIPQGENSYKTYTLQVTLTNPSWQECVISAPMNFYYNNLKIPSAGSTFEITVHV